MSHNLSIWWACTDPTASSMINYYKALYGRHLDWWRRQHDLWVSDHSEDATQWPVSAENRDEIPQIVENHIGECAIDLCLPEGVVALQPLIRPSARVPQDAFDLSTHRKHLPSFQYVTAMSHVIQCPVPNFSNSDSQNSHSIKTTCWPR